MRVARGAEILLLMSSCHLEQEGGRWGSQVLSPDFPAPAATLQRLGKEREITWFDILNGDLIQLV